MLAERDKTKEQLINELEDMRQRIAELEASETERKQAGDKIQQQSEFLNNVLDSLAYPLYVIDANDYTIMMANPAAKPGKLSEKSTCYALIHKRDKPCRGVGYVCPLQEVKKTRKPVVVEHIHYDEGGNARNVEVRGYPIFDSEGNVIQMIECNCDITERKRAEEALRESERKYRTLVEESLVGIVNVDIKGKITYVNETVLQGTGYSREEMVGKNAFRIGQIPRETVGVLRRRLKDRLMGKPPGLMQVQFRCKNGEWIWLQIKGKALWEHGMPVGVQIIGENITERKQVEQQLKESELLLNSIIEQSPFSTWISDDKGTNIRQNQACRELFGIEKDEEVIGKFNLFQDEEAVRQGFIPLIEEVFSKGKTVNFDMDYDFSKVRHVKVPGATHKIINCTIFPIKDAKGKVTNAVLQHKDITERKQMEEELQTSTQQWHATFDAISTAVCLLDMEGKILQCNIAMTGLLGKPFSEIIGSTCWELMHGTSGPVEGCPIVRMRETLRTETLILPIGERWFEVSVDPVLDDKGNLIGAVHIIADITERKQAEEKLRESEEKYRQLYETAPVMLCALDEKAVLLDCNKAFQETLGYRKEEMIGKHAYDFQTKESRELAPKALKKVAREGTIHGERDFITKDGKIMKVEFDGHMEYDEERNETVIKSAMKDITERKRSEEELRESEERYRALVSLGGEVGEVVIMLQDTGQGDAIQTFVSDEWCRITGYSRKELLSMSFLDLVHPKDRKDSLKRHKKKMSGESIPGLFEMSIIRKDGAEVPVELTSAYTTYQGQRANVAFIRDITGRKQAEAEKRELEQKAQLASRLASIGELAAGVAHEINNPLTGIIGFSERLLRRSTEEGARQHLEIIRDEARRAAKVIENLLTFARHREPKREQADINEILGRTLELRAYELRTSNIEPVVELTPGIPRVIVDFQQIQEVFLNIILNAEQVMTEANRRGKLSIKTEKVEDCIRISFTDDGPGIPAEHLDKIFDPFFTTRGERGGTGLGLSVCHGIVTGHGGTIYAESKPGKGATFVVELPVTTERQAIAKLQRNSLPQE